VTVGRERLTRRQESSLVEADVWTGYDAKASLNSELKHHGEGSLGDVKRRLDDEQLATWAEEGTKLGKEGCGVKKLVNDVEREGEVEGSRNADTIRLALMKSDAGGESGAMSLETDPLEHARLKVDRNDATRRADEMREVEREEARTTAEVERGHAFANVGREKAPGVLKPTPDPAVEVAGESDGTDGGLLFWHVLDLGAKA
jgi:hypothetical protein